MFGSDRVPGKPLRNYAANVVADGNGSIQLLAAAAQRISQWDRDQTRSAVRTGLGRTNNPHHRRVLALSALGAGEASLQVKKWLKQERENVLTYQTLDDMNFQAPKVGAAYAGPFGGV
jgi:hypothetical protein